MPTFELDEITIAELQKGMQSGRFTARSLAERYLERIRQIDREGPALNALIETNPDALAIADALDRERHEKGSRGPLDGVPVLIKDNIGTHDRMMTTAGSLALRGSIPAQDSFVAQQLRAAGAVFVGELSPAPLGDYLAGPNHVLPTGGWARSTGGLGLEAFMKTVTVQRVSKEGLERLAPTIEALAELEGMPRHKATARR